MDENLTLAQLNEHFKTGTLKGSIYYIREASILNYDELSVVIDSFPKVSPSLPQAILMSELSGDEVDDDDDDDDDEITVDV